MQELNEELSLNTEGSRTSDVLIEISEIKNRINKHYKERTKGCIFRSKARWYGEGEKSTKCYFVWRNYVTIKKQ